MGTVLASLGRLRQHEREDRLRSLLAAVLWEYGSTVRPSLADAIRQEIGGGDPAELAARVRAREEEKPSVDDPTVAEARERLADAVRASEEHCFWGASCDELRAAARALLGVEDEERRAHAERLVSLAALQPYASGECCDVPEEAGP